MKASVLIEKDSDGYYAFCQLPGCHTQGQTLEETLENIREAIELYVETLDPDELAALDAQQILATTVEV